MPRRSTTIYNTLQFDCLHCARSFSTQGGLKKHKNSAHKQAQFVSPSPPTYNLNTPSGSEHRDNKPSEDAQAFEDVNLEAVHTESCQFHPILNGNV